MLIVKCKIQDSAYAIDFNYHIIKNCVLSRICARISGQVVQGRNGETWRERNRKINGKEETVTQDYETSSREITREKERLDIL